MIQSQLLQKKEVLPKKQVSAEELRTLFKRSLWAFAVAGLGFGDLSNIHKEVCQLLQSPSKRKLIVLPRGFFKTSLVSIAYPLWLACHNPNIRILLVAKSYNNAARRVRMIRTLGIEKNTCLPYLYPHLRPKNIHKTKWSDEATCIERTQHFLESTFESAGIGTALPSRHYDLIIEDDPVAPEADTMTQESILPTPEELQKAIGFHKMLDTLLVPPFHLRTVVHVATRWDRKDVVQYILDNEKDEYETLVRGATTPEGEPVFPQMFGLEALERLKRKLGSQMYALQMDNVPLAPSEYMFKPGQINMYKKAPAELRKAITVDPALSDKRTASKAVVMVCGIDAEGNVYVLDYVAKRGMNPSDITSVVFSMHQQYQPQRTGIEKVGYQGALIFKHREEMEKKNYYFHIEELLPRGIDKNTRIRRLQPLGEAGKLWIRPAHGELLAELYDYPSSRSSTYDLLDALAYQIALLDPPRRKSSVQEGEGLFTLEGILEDIKKNRGNGLPFCLQN